MAAITKADRWLGDVERMEESYQRQLVYVQAMKEWKSKRQTSAQTEKLCGKRPTVIWSKQLGRNGQKQRLYLHHQLRVLKKRSGTTISVLQTCDTKRRKTWGGGEREKEEGEWRTICTTFVSFEVSHTTIMMISHRRSCFGHIPVSEISRKHPSSRWTFVH